MSFKLRDYQERISVEAAGILKNHKICYLSMEVRCGKTLTALNAAKLLGVKSVLFVTKKKAIGSIKGDYEMLNPDFAMEVINYESVHKMTGIYDLIVLDEAHCMGAFPKPTNRTRTIKEVCQGKPIIYLSGTPTPESYSQIYHQFFVSSYSPFKAYASFYKWANMFVTKKEKFLYGKAVNDYSEAKQEFIKKETDHLFLSFTQKQSGFEQKVTEKVLYCPMKPIIKTIIDRLRKDLVVEGKDDVILADTPVKLQQKIHQLSSGTVKGESGEGHILDDSKAVFIKKTFEGRKIAIYYKFKAEFEMLKQSFPNWTNSPEEFAESTDLVFLSQIVSGREGISLKTADALVFFNIDFSAVSYFQAKDRLTAKDRTKENTVYWIFSEGGIESKIYNCVKNKKDYTINYFKQDYGK
tara:strand:- start:336 stop:1565 length:1230 start_codon:yes stop_codon:yes gene_type:complete